MNRPDAEEHIMKIFRYARQADSLFALRTTIMVGFPGETEEQFGKVLDFLESAAIDRVGAFIFSLRTGLRLQMSGQIPVEIKEQRYRRLMELQSEIYRWTGSVFLKAGCLKYWLTKLISTTKLLGTFVS